MMHDDLIAYTWAGFFLLLAIATVIDGFMGWGYLTRDDNDIKNTRCEKCGKCTKCTVKLPDNWYILWSNRINRTILEGNGSSDSGRMVLSANSWPVNSIPPERAEKANIENTRDGYE
jgi:hypothetical protein